jgi:hypothetical protein
MDQANVKLEKKSVRVYAGAEDQIPPCGVVAAGLHWDE